MKAIDIYTDMGRFTIAAKHHQTVAELFEDNVANLETVIQHYQIAADYYKGEESTSSANKCLVKVAEYSATLEKYEKAIQIYEQVQFLSNFRILYFILKICFRLPLTASSQIY